VPGSTSTRSCDPSRTASGASTREHPLPAAAIRLTVVTKAASRPGPAGRAGGYPQRSTLLTSLRETYGTAARPATARLRLGKRMREMLACETLPVILGEKEWYLKPEARIGIL